MNCIYCQNCKTNTKGDEVGLDKRLGDQFYVSAHYGQFRPTARVSDNITRAYTLGIMKQLLTYVRLSAEYQLLRRPRDINNQRFNTEFYKKGEKTLYLQGRGMNRPTLGHFST